MIRPMDLRIAMVARLIVAVLALAAPARAQFFGPIGGSPASEATAPALAPENIRSPRATLETFLAAAARADRGDLDARSDAIACLEFGDFGRMLLDDARERLVSELADVLQRLGASTRLTEAPDMASVTQSGLTSWTLNLPSGAGIESFVFKKGPDQGWRFDDATLERVESMHDQLFGQDNFSSRFFRGVGLAWLADNRAMGLSYATWIGLFGTLLIGAFIDLIVRMLANFTARRYLRQHADDTHAEEAGDLIRRTALPFGLFGGGVAVYALLPLLDLSIRAQGILRTAAKAFFLFAAVWAVYRVVDLVAESFSRKARTNEAGGVNTLLIPLVTKAIKLFIFALGLIFIAESLNMPVTSLLAGVGIGGIALAVAAKGTLENVFGTVSVILDKPFRVGDYVKMAGAEGFVEDFNLRSSRVRTLDQSLVTIPNANLVSANIENFGARRYRRYRTTLSIPFSMKPSEIEEFCRALADSLAAYPGVKTDEVDVKLNAISASSLDVLVSVFVAGPQSFSDEYAMRHEITMQILRVAEKLGVSFAFPTQTLHMASGGMQPSLVKA